jgi:phosphatidylinositol alpha-1,6-mannosyltransferase
VIITGSVPWDQLPGHYAAGDVFAMPCRTRLRGLDVEGLGIVYLEASATGLPVVGGRSGGAPDAVLEGVTGHSVDGNDAVGLTENLVELLTDHAKAHQMGQAGRAWVQDKWTWDAQLDKLATILAG